MIFFKIIKRDFYEICLTITSNDSLTRRLSKIIFIFLFQKKIMIIKNSFIDSDYIEIHIVINKNIVFKICKKL